MRPIYEPNGRAREYAPLALNIYNGCVHGCRYCYVPKSPYIKREEFHEKAAPRKGIVEAVEKQAKKLRGDPREILLSFTSDPYPPVEADLAITRNIIKILIDNDLTFTVLTKSGTRAAGDFDLLRDYKKASFGTTLIFSSQAFADYWEPRAHPINNRIYAIERAKAIDIKTWISLEPVIEPSEALELIQELHPIVDHWKIGKINHFQEIERTHDWVKFREDARALLDSLGADYYFKKSLTELAT